MAEKQTISEEKLSRLLAEDSGEDQEISEEELSERLAEEEEQEFVGPLIPNVFEEEIEEEEDPNIASAIFGATELAAPGVGFAREALGVEAPFTAEDVGETIGGVLEPLGRPLRALEAGVGELQAGGDIGAAVRAAQAQLGPDADPILGFPELVEQDLLRQGVDPETARTQGFAAGTAAQVVLDPLNVVGAGITGVRQTVSGLMKGIQALKGPPIQIVDDVVAEAVSPTIGQRILGMFTKTPANDISLLKTNRERVEGARSFDEIRDESLDLLKKLEDEVKTAKTAKQIATETLRTTKARVNERLRSADVPADMPAQITDTMKDLRARVSQGSSFAFDILAQQDEAVDLTNTFDKLSLKIDSLKIRGVAPTPGSESAKGVDQLNRIKKTLTDLGIEDDPLSPEEAKQFIGQLDQELGPIYDKLGRGEFVNQGERALLEIRSGVDDELKKIPAYAEAMAPLADATKLLKKLNKTFGTDKRIFGSLRKITDPASGTKGLLTELDGTMGTDFIGQLSDFERSRLAKGKPSVIDTIPEIAAANQALQDANAKLEIAQLAQAKLGGLTTGTVEKALRSAMRPRTVDVQEKIGVLSGALNQGRNSPIDINQELRDVRLKEFFTRDRVAPGGSALVNAFIAASTGGTAAVLGGGGGGVGVAALLGAGFGTAMDIYGPRAVRNLVEFQTSKSAPITAIRTATGDLKNFGKLFVDPGKAINLMPGLTMEIVNPESDLNTSGEVVFSDPDELLEIRAFVLQSELDKTKQARIIREIDSGFLRLEKQGTLKASPNAQITTNIEELNDTVRKIRIDANKRFK